MSTNRHIQVQVTESKTEHFSIQDYCKKVILPT